MSTVLTIDVTEIFVIWELVEVISWFLSLIGIYTISWATMYTNRNLEQTVRALNLGTIVKFAF